MEIFRKYAVGSDFYFPLIDNGATDFESTPVTFVAGDSQIIKDGAAPVNTTNLPSHIGNGVYKLVLTAAELTAALIQLTIIDSATKLWEDQAILINTYGNAAAQHAFDLDTAIQPVNLTQIQGGAQSVTDFKDFVDDGYDPATNKVEGVKLVDTTTTNSDMRGTDGVDTATMRGTDGVDTTAMRGTDGVDTAAMRGTDGVDTAAMRGTDGALLATSAPTNFGDLAITVTAGKTTVGTNDDKTGYTLSSAGVQAIWDALTSAFVTVGSIGKKLADWVLGTDSKVLVTADVHSSGQTVAGVTGSVTAGTVLDKTGYSISGAKTTLDALNDAPDVSSDVTAIKVKTDNLPDGIAKGVALSNFTFLMLSSSDHFTPKTGATVSGSIGQDGGAFVALTNSVVEISDGLYKVNLTAAEMDTVKLTLLFTATGADDRVIYLFTNT